MPGFLEVVQNVWEINCLGDSAKNLSGKFKLLRKALKQWSTSILDLSKLVENCNKIIFFLDEIEEIRTLHIRQWNFRNIVKARLQHLLICKQEYWKKSFTAWWTKLGDENLSFFHSMATIQYHRNSISSLTREDGSVAMDHHEKVGFPWHL
jgi:hypothetical protein